MIDLINKIYIKFTTTNDIVFKLTNKEKICLWISLAFFFAYLT